MTIPHIMRLLTLAHMSRFQVGWINIWNYAFFGVEGQTQHIHFDKEMLGFFVKFGGASTKMVSYSWWFRNPEITSWRGKHPIDFPEFLCIPGWFSRRTVNNIMGIYRSIFWQTADRHSHLQLFRFRSLFFCDQKTDPLGIGIILICLFFVVNNRFKGLLSVNSFGFERVRVVSSVFVAVNLSARMIKVIHGLSWNNEPHLPTRRPKKKLCGSGGCASGIL